MARLIDDRFSRGFETARVLLGHRSFTSELAYAIRKEGGADKAVRALLAAFGLGANPYAISVEETLDRLREANDKNGWEIGDGVFAKLAKSAPDWPADPLAFRSLRIRWGKGDEGVETTFRRHVKWIGTVLAPRFREWGYLDPRSAYLQLLSGNETHRPVVEWVILDLGAHRERESVAKVRGADSIADEGLVLTWLFPEFVQEIDFLENPAFFLAGYKARTQGEEGWRRVPALLPESNGGAFLFANLIQNDEIGYSVPTVRRPRTNEL